MFLLQYFTVVKFPRDRKVVIDLAIEGFSATLTIRIATGDQIRKFI